MEERSGNPGRDGDQFPLPCKNLDLSGLGKLRQIYRTAVADKAAASSLAVTHGSSGSRRRGWINISSLLPALHAASKILQRVSVAQVEFTQHGAAQRLQVGAATQLLAHVVRDGSHVGSRRDPGAKTCQIARRFEDLEFLNFDLHRFQCNFLVLAGQLVSRYSLIFLAENGGGICSIDPAKAATEFAQLPQVIINCLGGPLGFAVGIVGVGRKAEADHSLVSLFRRV